MFVMLRRAAPGVLEAVHILIASLYVVLATVLGSMRVLVTVMLPIIHLGHRTGYDNLIRRFPLGSLAIALPTVTYFAAQGLLPFGQGAVAIVAGTACWLFLLHTVAIAYGAASAVPLQFDQYEAAINSYWPDRWYARHMKKPVDAIYVRRLVMNSLVLLPAAAAVIAPGTISPYSVAFFVLAHAMTGVAQESLDHTDMHNNLFAWKHLPRGGIKLVFWLTNRYLRLVLNTVSLRIPHFYRTQHLHIHHVENSGVRDTQTPVLHDRTSFFGFARFALALGLSWSFAIDVYRYLRAKGNRRECRLLILGLASWYGLLGLIALYNPAAALFFFVYRFLSGVATAQGVYFWHGLADPNDPENVFTNTVNLMLPEQSVAETVELHVLHHERSAVHFTKVINPDPKRHERWQKLGVLFISSAAASDGLFLQALLMRRFDVIADCIIRPEGVSKEDLMRVIEQRTLPVRPRRRGDYYARLDRRCAVLMATYLMPGQLPAVDSSPS